MIRVLFVCLGNICRSPLAEGVFKQLVEEQNLTEYFTADSAGTAAYHINELPDARSRRVAEKHGFRLQHFGRQIDLEDFTLFDYIVPMDYANLSDVLHLQTKAKLTPEKTPQIKLMLAYDADSKAKEVPDPYYDNEDGFEKVYQMLLKANRAFLEQLKQQHLPMSPQN